MHTAPAYRTLQGLRNSEQLQEIVRSGRLDAVVFTSSSCVQSFALAVGRAGIETLREEVAIACIGAVTAEAARACRLEPTIVANESTAAGITAAFVQALNWRLSALAEVTR